MTSVIIAGSRSIRDRHLVSRAIEDGDLIFGPIDTIIHGGANGVDSLAATIASGRGYDVKRVDANWDRNPKAGGPIRNKEMASMGDALVAVWDGESAGTKHMIDAAVEHDLDVLVINDA